MLAERLEGGGRVDAGFQHQEGAVPVDAVLGGEAVHAEGQKDVGDRSLFGSGEIARADADDFEGLVADVERAAEDVGIAAEAMIPIVPGEDRIGTGTGAAVIGGDEQAAERGLKAEEREHVAGDINDVGLLHVVVGGPGDVRAVGVADGDEVGLVLDGIAHELEVRRGPVAVLDRLAVEAGHLAGEDVEVAGIGDGQRAPEQGVDKTEGGDTGADAESEGKHSGHGRDLVAAELPPAETYIGEKRLKPSGSANAVARLALARSIEPNARRASLGSRPEAMASSMCDCNSSSISRFRRSPRTAFEIRDHNDMSCLPENPIDGQAD